jgi:putative transcriptional regulator
MKEVVGNTVYELRSDAIMTQEALACMLGVSRQTIIAIERGRYTPSVLLALKLSSVFKTPVEKIFRITIET